MTFSSTTRLANGVPDLAYKQGLRRNLISRLLTLIAGLFSAIAVLPLIAVLIYVLLKGGEKISFTLFTELPPPPGLEGGGIGNAIIGSIVETSGFTQPFAKRENEFGGDESGRALECHRFAVKKREQRNADRQPH